MPDMELKLVITTFQQALAEMKRDLANLQTSTHGLSLQVHDKLRLAEDIKKIERECKEDIAKEISSVREELRNDIANLAQTVTLLIKTLLGIGTSLVIGTVLYSVGI